MIRKISFCLAILMLAGLCSELQLEQAYGNTQGKELTAGEDYISNGLVKIQVTKGIRTNLLSFYLNKNTDNPAQAPRWTEACQILDKYLSGSGTFEDEENREIEVTKEDASASVSFSRIDKHSVKIREKELYGKGGTRKYRVTIYPGKYTVSVECLTSPDYARANRWEIRPARSNKYAFSLVTDNIEFKVTDATKRAYYPVFKDKNEKNFRYCFFYPNNFVPEENFLVGMTTAKKTSRNNNLTTYVSESKKTGKYIYNLYYNDPDNDGFFLFGHWLGKSLQVKESRKFVDKMLEDTNLNIPQPAESASIESKPDEKKEQQVREYSLNPALYDI